MAPQCCKCNENITSKRKPGVKCSKCNNQVHRECAKLSPAIQIWTCDKCVKVSRLSNSRSSWIHQRPSTSTSTTSANRGSLGSAKSQRADGNKISSMEQEIIELRAFNSKILQALTSMNERLELLMEYKDQNSALNVENRRLSMENTALNCELKKKTLSLNSSTTADRTKLSTRNETSLQSSDVNLNVRADNFKRLNDLSAINTMRWIHVSNLKSSTTCEDIRRHIMETTQIGRDEIHCVCLTPKSIVNPLYTCFKVGVIENRMNDIVLPSFWPTKTKIKEFVDEKNQNFRNARRRQSII